MLEDLFDGVNKKYHIEYDKSAKKDRIKPTCPPDFYEVLRQIDQEAFDQIGRHLFANFEEPEQEK